jgi:hypothetical protein
MEVSLITGDCSNVGITYTTHGRRKETEGGLNMNMDRNKNMNLNVNINLKIKFKIDIL